MGIVVVIVNYNTRALLLDCLASLQGGGLAGVDGRVIVVDNASTDGSADAVRAAYPWAEVMESGGNVGYAAANNMALRVAGYGDGPEDGGGRGDGPADRDAGVSAADAGASAAGAGGDVDAAGLPDVLLLNPDTIVPPGALAALSACFAAEPDLGVVGPKLVLADGSLDRACRRGFPTPAVSFYRFSGLARLFPGSPRFGRYNMTHLDPDAPADVDSVVGACMLVRGAAVRAVGLLDERFWMYGEDLDWALRLKAAGWRVGYRPHVVVHHVKRAASRHSPRARYEFTRAMWLFYRKHYDADAAWWVRGAVRLGLALKGGRRLAREIWAERGAEMGRIALPPEGAA